ncbi:MAG: hypothetical protein KGZ39_00590 [Simkania sp.]|nr:hypothetical protein [Simkania sp.]
MQSSDVSLNKNEEKHRKHWLIATVISLLILPTCQFMFLAIFSTEMPFSEDTMLELLATDIINLVAFWIVWRCAYKKPGTAILNLGLILTLFGMLVALFKLFSNPYDLWTVGLILPTLAISAWWCKLSLKLRQTNKLLQAQLALQQSPSAYGDSIQELRQLDNLASLDATFAELVKQWPQFEPNSSKEYTLKKLDLSKAPMSSE